MHHFVFDLAMKDKSCGGLGIKNPRLMNIAFVSKKFWKLLRKLWYFEIGETMVSASHKAGQSLGWKSILKGGEVKKYMQHQIGNGDSTKLWDDVWLYPNVH